MNKALAVGARVALVVSVLAASSAIGATTAVPRWQQIFHPAADGTTSAAPIAARELADGTVLVVTQALQTIHYNHDGTIVSARPLRLAAEGGGSVPKARRPTEPPHAGPSGEVNAHAAIDGFGRIAIATVAATNGVPRDVGIVEVQKFDGLTGEPLWPAPAFLHADSGEKPTAVFLDGPGDVVLTAVAEGNQKHTTVKYAGRDGTKLWGPVVIPDVAPPASLTTAAVDSAGNVYVSVPVSFPEAGIATRKYASLDGTLLWGPVMFPDPAALPAASAVTPDGNYVVAAGAHDEIVTLKYNFSSGAVVWGPSHLHLPTGSSGVSAHSLVANGVGDLFVSGTYAPPGGGPKFVTRKLAGANGIALWTAAPVDTFSGNNLPVQSAPTGNGDLIVGAALGTQVAPTVDFWRYRGSDGKPLWGPSAFGPIGSFDPPVFFVGSNGRIFTSELATVLSSGEIAASTGIPAWGPTDASFPQVLPIRLMDLAAGPDANPVVSGYSFGSATTLKYDRSTGSVLWGPVVFAPADQYVQVARVAIDSANDVFLLGFIQDLVEPFAYGNFVLKYSGATGALVWGPTVLEGLGEPIGLAIDSSGNALVGAWRPDDVQTHSALAKISGSTGAVAWGPVVFDSGTGGPDYADALALDPSGNAFLVGSSPGVPTEKWFALKYSGADGALVWGPSSGSLGIPHAAAVDAAGNLAVSGNDENGVMTTARYSGATGAMLWGPLNVADSEGGSVAIAANGDVVASGGFFQSGTQVDFVTVRYKANDGSVVWGPVVTDAGDDDIPFARGLGFDAGGNVVLGGHSEAASGLFDLSLVKYDGATGGTLWGPVHVGGPEDERLSGFDVRGNSIAVGGISGAAMLTAVLDESLGIGTFEPAMPNLHPGFCGQGYIAILFAQNGTPPYTWSIVSGSLPDGLNLSSSGAENISGTPTEQGTFRFTVRVTDSALAHADRDFELVVTEDPGNSAILATMTSPCRWTLLVPPGDWASYLWLPGGETTSSINVSPIETTTYGVVVSDGSSCALHLSVVIPGTTLQDPFCFAPAFGWIAPTSGPASGGTAVTLTGVHFEVGLQLEIGGQEVPATVVDPSQVTATTPALSPGTLNDVVVQNPDSGNAALLRGFLADFLDTPPSNIFHDSIERLFRRGVTAGCDPGLFCPDADTTRAQMAVFLLKSLLGADYVPPPATGGLFADVSVDTFAAAWIEDLSNRGITSGCQIDPPLYCPDANVSRAEMAVFLLKTKLGSGYTPPPATGTIFGDVTVDAFAAAWIEDLYNRGLTAGCQAAPLLFCPDAPVTRGEMAAFLVNTFGL